jgi:signal peptidase II
MMPGNRKLSDGWLAVLIVLAVLIIDQVLKIWVKTHLCLHESIRITDWFYILFIENNGMAFGMSLGSKLVLSLFRVGAIGVLGWYIWKQVKSNARTGYIVLLAMVLAGAAGNLIDCMFYGLVFNASSPFYLSYFVDFGEGYAPFLMGKVVDMFYFPIIETNWPEWMPILGGQHFVFFSPVFNFADSSISVSVVLLMLFYRHELSMIGSSAVTTQDGKGEKQEEVVESDSNKE